MRIGRKGDDSKTKVRIKIKMDKILERANIISKEEITGTPIKLTDRAGT